MSKQTKTEVHKGATKVAATISKVYDTVSKSGNIVTQCVSAVQQVYRGAEVPKADLAFIADNVARSRGWSSKSAQSRKSEVRKIVRNYLRIPEALKLYTAKVDSFTWHDAIKLTTQLNKDQTVRQAVSAMLSAPKAKAPTAMSVFGASINRIKNIETRSKKIIAFRKDLTKLLDKHGLA